MRESSLRLRALLALLVFNIVASIGAMLSPHVSAFFGPVAMSVSFVLYLWRRHYAVLLDHIVSAMLLGAIASVGMSLSPLAFPIHSHKDHHDGRPKAAWHPIHNSNEHDDRKPFVTPELFRAAVFPFVVFYTIFSTLTIARMLYAEVYAPHRPSLRVPKHTWGLILLVLVTNALLSILHMLTPFLALLLGALSIPISNGLLIARSSTNGKLRRLLDATVVAGYIAGTFALCSALYFVLLANAKNDPTKVQHAQTFKLYSQIFSHVFSSVYLILSTTLFSLALWKSCKLPQASSADFQAASVAFRILAVLNATFSMLSLPLIWPAPYFFLSMAGFLIAKLPRFPTLSKLISSAIGVAVAGSVVASTSFYAAFQSGVFKQPPGALLSLWTCVYIPILGILGVAFVCLSTAALLKMSREKASRGSSGVLLRERVQDSDEAPSLRSSSESAAVF